jgi:hypothetical protein
MMMRFLMAGTDQQIDRIATVQKKYIDMLMRKQHVVGVTIGPVHINGKTTGEFALIVLVDEKVPLTDLPLEDRIPSELDGVPVIVHPVGALEAL